MDEHEITSDKQKEETVNYEPIKIEQNEIIYDLNIETKEDNIIFCIIDKEEFPSIKYTKAMNFKEIKDLLKVVCTLNSFNDFYDYLKSLSNNKKLYIKKDNNKLSIILFVEVLLKQQEIVIDLFPSQKDLNFSIKEIYQELINIKKNFNTIESVKVLNQLSINENIALKNKINQIMVEIDNIKNENNELKKEIYIIKAENKKLKEEIEKQNKEINNLNEEIKKEFIEEIEDLIIDESVIMKEDEKNMIFSEIENKMNKKIKQIKKLYQATIDGGEPINFHLKCDNIPNTLVFIKSEGQRRFGGFTPIPWKSVQSPCWVEDSSMKTFVFSLDKKKIYYLKDKSNSVYHSKNQGPCFGEGHDIGIIGNPINGNKLYTCQSSYDYKEDKNALSEYDGSNKLKAIE